MNAPTVPGGFPALRDQLAGLAHLERIAFEQAAARDTAALPALPGSPGSAAGDQIAVLAAEMSAGTFPVPRKRPVLPDRARAAWLAVRGHR